jgi:glycosyltransferase involved in cell wall biosynthesis
VAPQDPAALAEAIDGVLHGEMLVDREEARLYAQRFLPDRVARAYLNEYGGLLGADAARAA